MSGHLSGENFIVLEKFPDSDECKALRQKNLIYCRSRLSCSSSADKETGQTA